jgi:hypothetical protein
MLLFCRSCTPRHGLLLLLSYFSTGPEITILVLSGRLQCWIEFSEQWQWQLYMTLVAVILFVVPALIILACYTVIVSTIWSKSKQMTPDPNRRLSRSEYSELQLCSQITFELLHAVQSYWALTMTFLYRRAERGYNAEFVTVTLFH